MFWGQSRGGKKYMNLGREDVVLVHSKASSSTGALVVAGSFQPLIIQLPNWPNTLLAASK